MFENTHDAMTLVDVRIISLALTFSRSVSSGQMRALLVFIYLFNLDHSFHTDVHVCSFPRYRLMEVTSAKD